jgi:hypothetical protein
MKSRDEIERQLCHIILVAAQSEADAGRGFTLPPDILADLRPPERVSAEVARLAVGVDDRVWEQELRRHLVMTDIVSGTRPRSRHAR